MRAAAPVLLAFVIATTPASTARAQSGEEAGDEAGPYGRQGSIHLGLGLGVGSTGHGAVYAGGLSLGYFVLTGVAPGADAEVSGGSGVLTTGLTTGTLRLVPIRTHRFAGFLIGRAGRVLVASHRDGWAAGGGAGVIFIMTGGRMGVQLAYEILGLMPSSFCRDLSNGCRLDSFSLGLVIGL